MGHDELLVVLDGLVGVPKARAARNNLNDAGLGLILLGVYQMTALIDRVVTFIGSLASVAPIFSWLKSGHGFGKATGPCCGDSHLFGPAKGNWGMIRREQGSFAAEGQTELGFPQVWHVLINWAPALVNH